MSAASRGRCGERTNRGLLLKAEAGVRSDIFEMKLQQKEWE